MPATNDPLAFAPPPEPGRGRAFGLAVLAHLLLAAALAWGVRWKSDPQVLSAEAELWAPVVEQAAPRLEDTPPPPPPPEPPAPAPEPKVQTPPPAPQTKDADIALKREQDKKKLEKKKREEAERKKKLAADEARKAEEAKKAEAKKKLEQQKLAEAQKKKEAAEKAAKDKAKEQAEAKKLDDMRQENLRRMQGLAGATGGATATGAAARSSGPSDAYAGLVRNLVNKKIRERVPGNPTTEVELHLAPDGTITSRKITKSSGSKAWDEAVLGALDSMGMLPRDTNGRIYSPLLMEFRSKD